jgi:hypothetical protein
MTLIWNLAVTSSLLRLSMDRLCARISVGLSPSPQSAQSNVVAMGSRTRLCLVTWSLWIVRLTHRLLLIFDLSGAVNIKIQTVGTCPSIIRQVGCQAPGDSCLLDAYEGTVDSRFQLPAGKSVRIKAIGEGWTSAYVGVTAGDSNRATVSYTQARGSFVTIDPDLLMSDTLIQIECDVRLQPKVFTVNLHSTCTRQPSFSVSAIRSVQVAPGTTAPILVSSDSKYVSVSWGGFFADHAICATNLQTTMRSCHDHSIPPNEIGELADGDIVELECPISTVYAKVVNLCPQPNPAIFGTTSQPESTILRAQTMLRRQSLPSEVIACVHLVSQVLLLRVAQTRSR